MLYSSQIAIVGNTWFPTRPGGLDRYVYELIQALTAAEGRVDLYGIGLPQAEETAGLCLKNLATPEMSFWQRLWSARHHSRSLRHTRADAINLHFALYGFAALPHLPPNVPVTCTFHGPWALESQKEGENGFKVWLKQQMEQRVYRRCDRFIVLSKAFGTILHQEYGVDWDKIHIIPGGVDTQRFQPSHSRQQAREALGWPGDRFILFTPRRLVHRMGLDVLLQAIAQLESEDIWLAIAGKGALREALEAQATALGLGERVKFLGFVPDGELSIAYQAADLAIMPSQSLEGFGLVLLEALASGTPALCTPVGGMPEVIRPFSPELVAQSPSAEAIAATLNGVLSGRIALPERSVCRDYAVTHFSWPTIAGRVQQVLLEGRS
ncbi:MAG: glycosyltransferase family 4 protein [Cyanobacteria bacterium P01_A01_bin.135]